MNQLRFFAIIMSAALMIMVGCQSSSSPTAERAEELAADLGMDAPIEDTSVDETASDTEMDGTDLGEPSPASAPTPKIASSNETSEAEELPTSDESEPKEAKVTEENPEPESTPEVAVVEPLKSSPESNAEPVVEASDVPKPDAKTADKPKTEKKKPSPRDQLAMLRARYLGQEPLEMKLLIPEQDFSTDSKHRALRISFDNIDLLKVLNMQPVPSDCVEHFPKWLSDLDGEKVIIRGWMYPPARDDGIQSFMFVRDSGLCCFGSNPLIYDKIAVRMKEGKTTHHVQGRAFDVVGTLKIEAEMLDDELFWLYRIEDAAVIDKR